MYKLADLMERDREELAQLETLVGAGWRLGCLAGGRRRGGEGVGSDWARVGWRKCASGSKCCGWTGQAEHCSTASLYSLCTYSRSWPVSTRGFI